MDNSEVPVPVNNTDPLVFFQTVKSSNPVRYLGETTMAYGTFSRHYRYYYMCMYHATRYYRKSDFMKNN